MHGWQGHEHMPITDCLASNGHRVRYLALNQRGALLAPPIE